LNFRQLKSPGIARGFFVPGANCPRLIPTAETVRNGFQKQHPKPAAAGWGGHMQPTDLTRCGGLSQSHGEAVRCLPFSVM
jgi:hypothetical protein